MSHIYHHPTVDDLLALLPFESLMPGLPKDFVPQGYDNPSYVPPYRGKVIVLTTIVSTIIIYPFVIFRLLIRRRSIGIKIDDWLMLVALIMITGMAIMLLVGVYVYGLGYHAYDLDLAHLEVLYTRLMVMRGKLVIVYILCWMTSVGVIRCSVLFLIRRIFGETSLVMHRISTAGIILAILYTIVRTVIFATQCHGTKATFNLRTRMDMHATCDDALLKVQILSWINIGFDTFVLLLPVHSIWTLNLPLAQRSRIMILFWLGVVVYITGVLRYVSYERVYATNDLGYDTAPSLFWSQVESATAIMVSSIPSLYNHCCAMRRVCWSRCREFGRSNATRSTSSKNVSDNLEASTQDPNSVFRIDEEVMHSQLGKLPTGNVDVKLLSWPVAELARTKDLCPSSVAFVQTL